MGRKGLMEVECLTDPIQMWVFNAVNVFMRVCSLFMAHPRRQTERQGSWISCSNILHQVLTKAKYSIGYVQHITTQHMLHRMH